MLAIQHQVVTFKQQNTKTREMHPAAIPQPFCSVSLPARGRCRLAAVPEALGHERLPLCRVWDCAVRGNTDEGCPLCPFSPRVVVQLLIFYLWPHGQDWFGNLSCPLLRMWVSGGVPLLGPQWVGAVRLELLSSTEDFNVQMLFKKWNILVFESPG